MFFQDRSKPHSQGTLGTGVWPLLPLASCRTDDARDPEAGFTAWPEEGSGVQQTNVEAGFCGEPLPGQWPCPQGSLLRSGRAELKTDLEPHGKHPNTAPHSRATGQAASTRPGVPLPPDQIAVYLAQSGVSGPGMSHTYFYTLESASRRDTDVPGTEHLLREQRVPGFCAGAAAGLLTRAGA